MDSQQYVHGYGDREARRLADQANILAEHLHYDTIFPKNSLILEAGCGTGAQTIHLARNNPQSSIIAIDLSPTSIVTAKMALNNRGYQNITFATADIFNLPYKNNTFDNIFCCFVLEHLAQPVRALTQLRTNLKNGGSITVIEGDHESTLFHPATSAAWDTIRCLIQLQAQAGGNSLIGRQLYPLLTQAHFTHIKVSPRFIYADASTPNIVEGFTKNTYIAMIEGIKNQAIQKGLITPERWKEGIHDLYKSAGSNGVFCYTFFKATGIK